MAIAEIARVLRKTQTHVKVLLFRARQTLAHEIAGLPADAPSRTPHHASRNSLDPSPLTLHVSRL
jgi:hypothetical protein